MKDLEFFTNNVRDRRSSAIAAQKHTYFPHPRGVRWGRVHVLEKIPKKVVYPYLTIFD